MKRIIKEFELSRIAAVDRPCQQGAVVTILKRAFSEDKREKLADKGHAMKDGGYPIENHKDVENAVQSFGRAKNKAATKKHIIRNAKRVGATHLLPDKWNVSKSIVTADWITKQFLAFPMMFGDGDDDDGPDDFDATFADNVENQLKSSIGSELYSYTDALRTTVAGILACSDTDHDGKRAKIKESVDQFVTSLEEHYPIIADQLGKAVEKAYIEDLRKRFLMAKVTLLSRMAKQQMENRHGLG